MIFAIGMIGFAGIILTQQVFAEDSSFDSAHDFSGIDFDTGRFSYLPYGEKFYQYKSQPLGAPASESYTRCHFTSDFVLSKSSFSDSGNVIYRFPDDMVWPGGYENSTFYIVRSPSFNFPEDHKFEKLTPAKTDGSIVLEFDIITGLNTFVANSTAFWDPQRSHIMNCPNPFDFEKQEYEYYDFVYPLKVQQNRAKMLGLTDDDFLCKPELISVLKYDGSPACVKPETKEKLEQRGWAHHKETLLVLHDNPQDIGRYLKQVSILDESSIDATVSYPTNTAHHKMFPDEYQSIVSDCTEKNNDANLSLLYLKETDSVQNKMTFTVEDKKFDGLQCDDALWQELTRWGYCGPPDHVIPHIDVVVPSVADAQRKVGFVFDVPKYLPEGYDIQKVTVGRDNDRATLYISPEPITDETQACDFAWGHEGIYLFYGMHPEILSFGSSYSDAPGEPQTWPVTINGNPGKAEQRWVGDRFGMPIPQLSDLQVSMPDEGVLVSMSSSLPVEELIRIAESISDPIFNSDIIPDYSRIALQAKTSSDDDNSIPVKITGNTSKQICNKIKMACDDGHFFIAMYDMHTDTATLEQSVNYNNYVLEISNRELCYRINGDPSDYCSFLNADYSSILDGNKPAMLSQPLDFWKNTSREEQLSFHEEYGDLFFEELGKIVLKDEIKKELEKQNIRNTNNDFRLHTGMVEESLPPYVHYTTVINSTDGKSYMFGGRTHTNQVLDVYHEELIFYDDVSAKLPIDSFRNDSPVIVIRPENESDANIDKLFVNFDKNQDVTFVNSLSVPIRIQDKGSGNPEKEHELAWIGPAIEPNETWIFQINSTGYYEWDAKIAPTEPGSWWEPHESGDIMAYSEDMSDVDFREKLRIGRRVCHGF